MTSRRFAATVFITILIIGVIQLLTGCASSSPAEPEAHKARKLAKRLDVPLSAVVVTTCGKSVALYVVTDAQHMYLFTGAQTRMYEAVSPGVPPKESAADPIEFNQAIELAKRAPLTSHVMMPCMDTVL